MASEETLLGCPFCGSQDISISSYDVECHGCGATVSGGDEALDRWNSRAAIAALQQESPRAEAWRSIDTAPEDCRVILATAGNWVGEAIMLRDEDTGEQVWTWVDTGKPSLHTCYGWRPLPEPLIVPVEREQ